MSNPERDNYKLSDEHFVAVVQRGIEASNGPDLADKIGVSYSTVARWATGLNLPHSAMRPGVIQAIQELVLG